MTIIVESEKDKQLIDGLPNIVPLNYLDLNLKYVKSSEQKVSGFSDLTFYIIISIIYSIIFYIFKQHWEESKSKIKLEMDNHKLDLEKIEKGVIEHQIRVDRVRNANSKMKILFMKKIQDLKIENEFYKSLLLVIAKKDKNKITGEEISDEIRNHLKTYSTKSDIDTDLNSLEIVSNIITEVD